ncbi:TetR/AcrR family transcriptional regulator [Tsukamurella soli]|uniref:TetR/AcrR family transcriptional regulator n=1 Tax=Tsukamurella soli TaxID=644556 RepID=A0ABP8JNN4_9ACTN
MGATEFQRARSPEAKAVREAAILDAARTLAEQHGTRDVTLTDIAAHVGMHKSAMLRYFETREEIFLRLTAARWQEWVPALCGRIAGLAAPATVDGVAAAFASTLAERGLFCDLLAQAPMNLERNVSVERVREFKLVTRSALDRIAAALTAALPALTAIDAADVVGTATSLAGTFHQISTPPPAIAALYRSDPRLGHALIDLDPRLQRILAATLSGLVARSR